MLGSNDGRRLILQVVGVLVLSLLVGAVAHRVGGVAARAAIPFALLIPVGILSLAWWRESARSARWRGVLDAFAERELAAAGQEAALSMDALSETRVHPPGPSQAPAAGRQRRRLERRAVLPLRGARLGEGGTETDARCPFAASPRPTLSRRPPRPRQSHVPGDVTCGRGTRKKSPAG
jgi:hypothetical protein